MLKALTENEIGPARLSVTIAGQKLQEAHIYLVVLLGVTESQAGTGGAGGARATLDKLIELLESRQAGL